MGKELGDTINKVLKNKKIINFLKEENKENKGFLLGKIEYFDDINVLIMFGITLDKKDKSKAKLFSYELFPHSAGEGYDFRFRETLPEIPEWAQGKIYPTTKEIGGLIKEILDNPKKRLIDYSPFLKNI